MKATFFLLMLPLSLYALTPIELEQLQENPEKSYIYCDKVHSKMAAIIAEMSEFDENTQSPIWKLKQHINNGFSIEEEDAAIQALAHAEYILENNYKQLDSYQAQQLYAALASVVDQLTDGQLTVHFHDVILSQVPDRCCKIENTEDCRQEIIKVRKKLYVLESAKFFKDVEMKKNLTVSDNLRVDGTSTMNNIDIDCDLTVGCNISMNDSISPSVGNVIKNGNRFIHNTGPENTFVGTNAGNFNMIGFGNTGIGSQALQSNISGLGNTAIGFSTLVSNTSGSGNVAVGPLALNAHIGFINTAIGTLSLMNNITGNANCGLGFFSLSSNTTGNDNIAIGAATLTANTFGHENTAIGTTALMNNITGSRNIAIGKNTGNTLISGDNNIYIANAGAASESGTIRIGTSSTHTAAFIQGIFGATVGGSGLAVEVDVNGQLGTIVSSNEFKKDIANMDIDSANLYKLHPVKFVYKNDTTNAQQYGLIAEEVEQAFPELVVYNREGKPYSVRYQVLPVLLLNELQKQQTTIENCINSINALTGRVAYLETRA